MLLWVGFALLTAAVVGVLLRPLLAGAAPADPQGQSPGSTDPTAVASAAVYRDQLAEIESERARGLIAEAEAEAARVEIARRLLAAGDVAKAHVPVPARTDVRMVGMVLASALPLLAVIVYLAIGTPGQPGQPFAARAPDTTGPGVQQLVAQVEARLRAQPEDGRGWDVIAPVYLRMGRYNEAADAFGRALRLVGESPERLAGLAEAHVLANDGMVTEIARTSYERLRALAPERLEPRFWLAVAAEQDGRSEEAAKAYAQLLIEGDAAAPWRPTVAERWRTVRRKLGLPTDPVPDGKAEATPTGMAPALAREDVSAIQQLPEDQRKRVIEDMVSGLDKRLAENGQDLEGWQRLIRAYTVLGRRDDAIAALGRARTALAAETAALEALSSLARTLGLSS